MNVIKIFQLHNVCMVTRELFVVAVKFKEYICRQSDPLSLFMLQYTLCSGEYDGVLIWQCFNLVES